MANGQLTDEQWAYRMRACNETLGESVCQVMGGSMTKGQRRPSEYPGIAVAKEADQLEAELDAAGLDDTAIDAVWDTYVRVGLKSARQHMAQLESPIRQVARQTMPELYRS